MVVPFPAGKDGEDLWVSLRGSAPRRGCARGGRRRPETASKRGLPQAEVESLEAGVRKCDCVYVCARFCAGRLINSARDHRARNRARFSGYANESG